MFYSDRFYCKRNLIFINQKFIKLESVLGILNIINKVVFVKIWSIKTINSRLYAYYKHKSFREDVKTFNGLKYNQNKLY